MAIVWGAKSKRMWFGLDVVQSPAVVTKDTASVNLTFKLYWKQDYSSGGYNQTSTVTVSGSVSDSFNHSFTGSGVNVAYFVEQWTISVPTSYSGTVTRSITCTNGAPFFDGADPTVTRSWTVAKRPPQAPAAPSSAAVARSSDSALVVSLTAPASWDDAGTKWDNVVVQRSVDGASYVAVATLAGSARSWTDTSVSANHQYSYRIYSRNVSGSSGYVYTSLLQTTPAAPTSVGAAKSGSDIVVTWAENNPYAAQFEVRDNGVLVGTTTAGVTIYTVVAPDPGVTHQYTVRAKTTTAPTLYSTYGTSNTVQLQAPPNAPTGLDPNGESVDAAEDTVLTWIHNPVDTTTQTQFELQHRLVGAGSWTSTGVITSGASSYTLPAGTYPSGSNVEGQVKTRGAHATFSPFSAVATFKLISRPVVGIIAPTGPGYDSSILVVDWTYFQAEGLSQVSWTVVVTNLDTGGTVATVTGQGTATSWSSVTPLLNNDVNYRITVTVRESGGLTSVPEFVDILVTFEPPTPPLVTAEWKDCFGYNEVTMQATDLEGPETVSLVLERSVNGNAWETLGTFDGTEATYLDWTAPVVGHIVYRATAITALPSSSSEEFVLDIDQGSCDSSVYISGGTSFALVARLEAVDTHSATVGRQRTLNQYAGRTSPVESSGLVVDVAVSVKAKFLPEQECDGCARVSPQDIEQIFSLAGPHLYRDTEGRTMYAFLSPASVDYTYLGDLSFTATRANGGTPAQLAAISAFNGPLVVESGPGEYRIIGGTTIEELPAEWTWSP